MKLIGLTSSSTENRTFVNAAYHSAFTREGMLPVALPQFAAPNRETITQDEYYDYHRIKVEAYAHALSSLCVTGGIDIQPLTFDDPNWGALLCDSERDMMELALIRAFVEAGKPIMGICRGHQLLARFLGLPNFVQDLGKLNELHNAAEREIKDRQEPAHSVYVLGRLREYLSLKTGRDVDTLRINSWHHQSLCLTKSGVIPKNVKTEEQYAAWFAGAIPAYERASSINILACTNMVIEAFEKPDAKMYGIQFHGEEYGPNGLSIGYFVDKYLNA